MLHIGRSLQHLLLAVLLQNVILIRAICPQGFVDINGQCLQQSSSCPQNYGLVNGMCYPASTTNQNLNGQISVPNQPNPPCPNQPISPCPSQPVVPNQLVSPCPNQPVSPCPNQPLIPIQPVSPCPNQPLTPNQPVAPCPNQPVSSCPNQPLIPNQPVAPCPNQPVVPNQPATPYPTQTPNPTPIPPTTTTSTTQPRPAEIVRCPEGTILIGGACRLIYCGKGVYINKRCVQTECPGATVWTGIKCAPPEPIVHSAFFNNTVITHFDRTEPDVIVNNVNNMVVNASIDLSQLPRSTACDQNEDDDGADCDMQTTITPIHNSTTVGTDAKCCTVMTPRLCRLNDAGNRWNCYNRRHKQCGDFCIASKIYLHAPQPRQTARHMVLPPDLGFGNCRKSQTCPESKDLYDCSGCTLGHVESCSSYCYQYLCPKNSCSFYDQREYCSLLPGDYGCQEQDGCHDSWCSGY